MARFVLDASVALSRCFPDDPSENTPFIRAILRHIEIADPVVPEIWAIEIANAIFVAASKRHRVNDAEIAQYIRLLDSLPIRLVRASWIETIALHEVARKFNLAAYDSSYLALAMRENLPIATSDKPLSKAAKVAGVPLL